MATQKGELTLSMEDKFGVPASLHTFINIDDSKTLAVVMSEMGTFALDTDALTDAVITEISVRVIQPGGSPLKTTAGDNPVEMTGLFNLSQDGVMWKYGIDVPAISATLITNGRIDLSNAAVTTWIAWLTTAHTALTAVSKFFLALGGLLDALISFRKHRRAETRRSYEVGS